jgi:hypothetical protein
MKIKNKRFNKYLNLKNKTIPKTKQVKTSDIIKILINPNSKPIPSSLRVF